MVRHPPAPLPFGPASIARLLEGRRLTMPHAEALVDDHHRLDYGGLDELVGSVAAGLLGLGLEPHDRVTVSLPNSVHTVVVYLACMRAGLVFVGVHTGLAAVEKRAILDVANPDLVIGTPAVIESLAGRGAVGVALDLDDLTIGELAGGPGPPTTLPDPLAPAAIAFTSGTTGTPKGVVHDQHHMVLPASVILHERLQGARERVGVHLPLTTLNVLILGPVLALLGGGTCVCIDGHDAEMLADTIERERLDHLATSPAVVHDLLTHSGIDAQRQLAGLRLGVGGTACSEQLRDAYRSAVGREFTTGYGLSEAPAAVTQETERVPHREGASGVAMAHVEVEIVDDDDHVVAAGEVGEITLVPKATGRWAQCFRGMHAYLDQPDESARVAAGGRLRTGDVGALDSNRYLYVSDRRSDMINRGGSKVSPIEVERVVLRHPSVADCIVIGRPSERLGETVAVLVQTRAGDVVTPEELRRHCASELARYKVPTDVVVVDALPRNPMGKVVRDRAREWFDTPDTAT